MKKIKTHHTKWALGASAALASLGSAQAALVKVDLNHDLTTTLDGVDFGQGLGVDAGQWVSANVGPNVKSWRFSLISTGNAVNKASFSQYPVLSTYGLPLRVSSRFEAAAGSNNSGVQNFSSNMVNSNRSGLIAWNLNNGTEGWLHVTSSASTAGTAITANYFAFDDERVGVAGGRTAGNLTHGGNSEAFAAATNFTAVPEPSSLALLALGAAGVIGRRKRRAA